MQIHIGREGEPELESLAKVNQITPGYEVSFYGPRKVREAVPFVSGSRWHDVPRPKKDRMAREGEIPSYYKVYLHPPVYDTTDKYKEPYFDTMKCGEAFGFRLAELGSRLTRKTEAA
jgi:hypothetical protein